MAGATNAEPNTKRNMKTLLGELCQMKDGPSCISLCGVSGTTAPTVGGAIEDNYPPAAIALGVLCFPCGIIGCCMLKERQCVKCNRSFA